MPAEMVPKMSMRCESNVALLAQERLLAAVNPVVCLEVAFLGKTLLTLRACERFNPLVSPEMYLETAGP